MFGPSKLEFDPTFDAVIPNPVKVVQRYWPSRAHSPSFALVRDSMQYRRRPIAVGSLETDLMAAVGPTPVPCDDASALDFAACPGGGNCCAASRGFYPEAGLPFNVCTDERGCALLQTQLERLTCAAHPDETLDCWQDPDYGEVCVCSQPWGPVVGQIPGGGGTTIEPPPTITQPPLTTEPETLPPAGPVPAASSPVSEKEKLMVIGAVTVSLIGLIYLARR